MPVPAFIIFKGGGGRMGKSVLLKSVWVQGALDIVVEDCCVVLRVKGKEIFRISAKEIMEICGGGVSG